MFRRAALALAGAAIVVVAFVPSALAHVTVQPPEAVKGSFAKLAIRVPNEEDDAATIKLELQLPVEIESARTKPTPGWTAEVAADTITWEGGRIEPGEFQEFEISVGPLPEVDQLVFKAVQTYDNGVVARWVEETTDGGEEPEHPAPVLKLIEGDDGHGASTDETESDEETEVAAEPTASSVDQDDVDSARTLAIVGIVVGALGLIAGASALAASRRRS